MNFTTFPEAGAGYFETVLGLLEKGSDEAFWNNILGERAMKLLGRYFGSDVVFLGFIVYLAPLFGHQFTRFFHWMYYKITESMYISIQISQKENGYDAVQEFVSLKTAGLRNLRTVEGRCVSPKDADLEAHAPSPKLTLYPLDEVEHEIFYKGHKLWVTRMKSGGTNKQNDFYTNDLKELFVAMSANPCINVTMRGTKLEKLRGIIQEWVDDYHDKRNGKLTIHKCMPTRYDGYEWTSVGSKELRPFDSVVLKEGQKELILKDIQRFRQRESWYANRGIPYRRGYLLFGPPGTGKTSLVQSVASKVNMNVAIISLSGAMNDENLSILINEIPRNSILVMEDIDHCTIKDPSSDKDNESSKMTMSGLLNALDGVTAQEGSMVFMTCNDINLLQPALLRPGRIDVKMELGYADKNQILHMCLRFLTDDAPTKSQYGLAEKFTELIPDLTVTPAELQNFFIMNIMDKHDITDYNYILEAVPRFLENVKIDRNQAIEHKDAKNVKKM
ncbi:P-loop containing nucleoside triphosphate hydrolase protein [Sporodiniella umbellata]|nr:P-loop containing nucleoside triphosphate hydrolase protein [Sporodiniella umbellata]